MVTMSVAPDIHIVASDHPSLDKDVERFLDDLRAQPRYFGPSAAANPKPFPSLIAALAEREGFRLAAVECGRIIALGRLDGAGEIHIAVTADRRGLGVGTAVGRAIIARARELGYGLVTMRTTRRSRAVRGVAEQLGGVMVELDRGRIDVILDLSTD